MKKNHIQVTAYSGYRVFERPMSFILEGQSHAVKKILRRSLQESTDGVRTYQFHILCENDREFTIFYDISECTWYIEGSPQVAARNHS
jgi:hypothetical protein